MKAGCLFSALLFVWSGFAYAKSCESLLSHPYIIQEDASALHDIVNERGDMIMLVMAPNPDSLDYYKKKGYVAKTAELKNCKSAKSGESRGLVHCPPEYFASQDEWEQNKAYLESLGYRILGSEHNYVVQRISDGKYFYSDYDLLDMRDFRGNPIYTEDLRQEINAHLGRRQVRHAPLAQYSEIDAVTIKFPILAFVANVGVVEIHSRKELIEFYGQHNLPLPNFRFPQAQPRAR